MSTTEEQMEQIEQRVRPLLAKRFWLFYFGSLILALLFSYHHVFSVLPRPVTTNGTTTASNTMYQMRGYSRFGRSYTVKINARGIHYTWQGKSYDIIGGWDEDMSRSVPVRVIFDADHPEKAFELSVIGLMDVKVLNWVVPVWIFLTGFLIAFASSDSHFTALSFNIPNLTIKSFIYTFAVILLIPLFPSTDLLLFGKKADGMRGDEPAYRDGHYYSAINFKAGGGQYVVYSQYAEEYEPGMDRHFPILYQADNPNRACLFQFGPLYSNNPYLLVLMGFCLILLLAWFSASRMNSFIGA